MEFGTNLASDLFQELQASFQGDKAKPLEINTGGKDDRVHVELNWDGSADVSINGKETHYSAEMAKNMVINTEGGNDQVTISGHVSADNAPSITVNGGDGADKLSAQHYSNGQSNLTFLGGDGDDTLMGAALAKGGDGNDHIVGTNGNDRLIGGSGNDIIIGSAGDDELLGGGGDLFSIIRQLREGDDDLIVSGAGNDTVRAGLGNDRVDGELDEVVGANSDWMPVFPDEHGQTPVNQEPMAEDNDHPASNQGSNSYTVKPGDSLSIIAQNQLGNAARFVEIAQANGIAGPDYVIRPGQELVIPGEDKPFEIKPIEIKPIQTEQANTGNEPRIDFDFISRLEGGRRTDGYVPDVEHSKSGVTIATGFDLGQRNENDLKKLGLDQSLIDQLKPYLGLKGEAAEAKLKEMPLNISEDQAKFIDKVVKEKLVDDLIRRYDSVSEVKFVDLPPEMQTVIASVAFQYGALDLKTPDFWTAVTNQDWDGAYQELNDFKDSYPTRRKKEAKYMMNVLA